MGRPPVREFARRIPAGIHLETIRAENTHAENIVGMPSAPHTRTQNAGPT